ncbi:MAG: UDP-3-O-(3-hydroxymyristoyl)glucosamine N-acyltransferase [Bacteroidota bacterium]
MKFKAKDIAALIQGEVDGNPDVEVYKLARIEEGVPGSISFLGNPKYTHFIYSTQASVVIVNRDFIPEKKIECTIIRVENAYQGFASLLEQYNQIKLNKSGIEQPSFISDTATIGKNCYIGAFAYIGQNAVIGDNVKIYPNTYVGDNVSVGKNTTLFAGVKIYSDCVVGESCLFHGGVVIGGDGFGYTSGDTINSKITQIGNVVIGNDVELGSNTTIDRATLGSTIIHDGVKLDNLIQVGHNAEIGENTVICSQTGVAGSTKIGKNCLIGGQVGIIGHLVIADNVKIAAQSGIGASIEQTGALVQGSPAFNIGEYKRSYILFKNLPDLSKRINELEKKK